MGGLGNDTFVFARLPSVRFGLRVRNPLDRLLLVRGPLLKVPESVISKRDGGVGVVEGGCSVGGRVYLQLHTPDGQPIASLGMDAAAFLSREQAEGSVFVYPGDCVGPVAR